MLNLDGMMLMEALAHQQALYHISFRDKLDGIWKPMLPDGMQLDDGVSNNTYSSEPDIPRISFSPTLKQCFWAIYPNISHLFEELHYPYMTLYVYSPVFKGTERLLSSGDLQRRRYVHDAHITGEVSCLDPVQMKRGIEIRVMNTNGSPFVKYYPFDDRRRPQRELAPERVEIWQVDTHKKAQDVKINSR